MFLEEDAGKMLAKTRPHQQTLALQRSEVLVLPLVVKKTDTILMTEMASLAAPAVPQVECPQLGQSGRFRDWKVSGCIRSRFHRVGADRQKSLFVPLCIFIQC